MGESITYKSLGRNTGISHALNEGIKLAMPYVDFIITMDQDSLLTEDIINVYKKFINNFSGKVPVLCPGGRSGTGAGEKGIFKS